MNRSDCPMSLRNRVVNLRGFAIGVVKLPNDAIRESGESELYEDDRILLSGVFNSDSLPVLCTLSVIVREGVTIGRRRHRTRARRRQGLTLAVAKACPP